MKKINKCWDFLEFYSRFYFVLESIFFKQKKLNSKFGILPNKLSVIGIIILFSMKLNAQVGAPNFAGEDKVICLGQCLELGTDFSGAECSYKWSPTTGMSSPSDQSTPNPTVCPTITTTYTLTVTDETNVYTDQITIRVGSSDLQIFKPEILAGNNSTSISETEEETLGAMSFPNLDNDDGDTHFDNNDKKVIGGDDELMKLVIKTSPAIPEMKIVKLLASKGNQYVKIWKSQDKTAGEYNLGNDLTLTTVLNDEYVMELWVEGVSAHTIQQGTILELEIPNNDVICENDKVAITLVGVKDLTWRGIGNGFNPNSTPQHNNVELDTNDPNFPASASPVVSRRVFPGARSPSYTTAKDVVELRVNLTVSPIEKFNLYLKTFDIDDPFAETVLPNAGYHIDPNDSGPNGSNGIYPGTTILYTVEEDNRGDVKLGTTKSKAGIIMDDDNNSIQDNMNVGVIMFKESDLNKILHFKVSEHPGDNYRVAVNADKDFINALRNTDVHHGIDVSYPGIGKIEQEVNYATDVLTVWRILHVENESMLNYQWQYNNTGTLPRSIDIQQRYGIILDFSSSAVIPTGLQIDEFRTTPTLSVGDNSLHLTTGGNGRFEHGQMIIGLSSNPANMVPLVNSIIIGVQGTPIIEGNSNTSIRFNAPQSIANIWGELTNPNGGPNIDFNVINVTKDGALFIWEINNIVFPPGLTLTNFIGESIRLGGSPIPVNITDADNIASTITTNHMVIPFLIRDDDKLPTNNILPYSQDLSALRTAFEQAYILTENDGGGTPTSNNNGLSFIENIRNQDHVSMTNAQRASSNNESSHFWCVYISSAWQYFPSEDADANAELIKTWGGTTFPPATNQINLAVGGNISYIFREVFLDQPPAAIMTEPMVTAHEVGHQFGLDHGLDIIQIPEYPLVGLMGSGNSFTAGNNGTIIPVNLFIARHLNLIRSRINSPGQ